MNVEDREAQLMAIKDFFPFDFICESDGIFDDLFFNNPIMRCFDNV